MSNQTEPQTPDRARRIQSKPFARGFLLVLFTTLLLLVCSSIVNADIIYNDSTFNIADWSVGTASSGNGETVNASQENDGPPQDQYRRVTHNVTNGSNSYVQGRHLRLGWEYDPSASGPIDSLSIEYKIQKPATDPYYFGLGFLLEQDGHLYYDSAHYQGHPPSITTWQTVNFSSMISDFSILDGTGGTLDFSNTAAPIHFGLFTANSFDPNFPSGYASSYNIDDLTIQVHSSVPEPSSGILLPLALLGFVNGYRRRRRTQSNGRKNTVSLGI